MTDTQGNKRWREFEQLVALLEYHLASKGAAVRSPDRITDKTTGKPREVDASVRYQVGSVPILITIECRDRTSIEDVTWIEQLIAKRESIGASATVAVSSTGFSEPAIQKARANSIEIRLLREVSEKAVRDWAQHIEIVGISGKFGMGPLRLQIKPAPENPNPELHPDIKREYAKGDVEYKFIRRVADGRLISIGDLLRDAEREAGNSVYDHVGQDVTVTLPPKSTAAIVISSSFPSLFDDVPVGQAPLIKTRGWWFDPNEATVETNFGPAELHYLEVEFRVIQRAYPSQIGRLLCYEDSEGPIGNIEQRHVSLGEGKSVRVIISGKA